MPRRDVDRAIACTTTRYSFAVCQRVPQKLCDISSDLNETMNETLVVCVCAIPRPEDRIASHPFPPPEQFRRFPNADDETE